ncbi:MAG: DUF1080 domain-containing protein [Planctomycetaceae bacterium]|jgi:hypothetical protein|nr:DUF1080 domain-containing protein [Planctomycetaceae bacterium]
MTRKNVFAPVLFTVFVLISMESVSAGLFSRTVVKSYIGPESPLFNGQDLSGWVTVGGSPKIDGWEAVDGMIHRTTGRGDIVTEKEYRNFVLDFRWKIAPGGNSGLKYKFSKLGNDWLGCEFQLIDDIKNSEGKRPKHGTGDLYDMIPAENREVLPVGEWNHSRVVVNGGRIQHWLNGKLTVDVTVGSPTWEKAFAESKFKDHPEFGKIADGKILLQDHGDEVWFKDITIREIQTGSVRKMFPVLRNKPGILRRLKIHR